jgi:hypothetical protein
MHRYTKIFAPILLILILCACSEAPKETAEKPKEPEKPAEPVTGRYAFQQMFVSARGWATDAQVLSVSSIRLPEVKSAAGKAGAWQAIFVSEGHRKQRMYTYSVIETAGNLHKGVFAGLEDTYSGPRGLAKPFPAVAVRTDTDDAYKTALKHAAETTKKNPNIPISFVLEQTPRFPDAAWRVIWGESVAASNFSIYVDASTGDYLQTMR